MKPRFADQSFKARNLGSDDAPAQRRQTVVNAARIIRGVARHFHDSLLNKPLQIVVERARSEFVTPIRLASYLLHDGVAMQIFAGKR